jgi:DNA ligase (NAD+)
LGKFVYALGILNVGEQTSEDLANHFQDIEKLQNAGIEEINSIENIGPVVSQSIYDWFRHEENLKFINKLFQNGVQIKQQIKASASALKFKGKTFVLTGTLRTMGRDEAKKKIKALGGKVSSSVSKRTDYVVAGSEPGSKYSKALELDLKVLGEKEFIKLISS